MEASCGVSEGSGRHQSGVTFVHSDGEEISSCTDGEEHVTQLGQGRICQHFLDVHVVHRHGGGEECGHSSDYRYEQHYFRVHCEQREAPCNEVYSCLNHGCRMDKCGDGGRSGHCVRKPVQQRELSGFSDGTAEDQHCCEEQGVGICCGEVCAVEDVYIVKAAHCLVKDEQTCHETDVSEPGDEESLLGRGCGVVGLVVALGVVEAPESDKEVGAETHDFPEDEHLDEVAGSSQSEHSGKEECDFCEVSPLPLALVAHVSERVDEDQHRDERCEEHHQAGQGVHVVTEVDVESTKGEPLDGAGHVSGVAVGRAGEEVVRHEHRHHEGERGSEDCHISAVLELRAHLLSEESDDQEAQYGYERDKPSIVYEAHLTTSLC